MPITIHLPKYSDTQGRADEWLTDILKDKKPSDAEVMSVCFVEIAPGIRLRGIAWGNHIFVDAENNPFFKVWLPDVEERLPFFRATVMGQAFTKKATKEVRQTGYHYNTWKSVTDIDTYDASQNDNNDNWRRKEKDKDWAPYAYLRIKISVEGSESKEAEFKFRQPKTGVSRVTSDHRVTTTSEFFGMTRTWSEPLKQDTSGETYSSHTGLWVLYTHLKGSTIPDGGDAWWDAFFAANPNSFGDDVTGLSGILKKKDIAPNIARLQKESPTDWKFFQWLQSGATILKQKNNALLASFLLKVGFDYDTLLKELRKARFTTAPATEPEYNDYHVKTEQGWFVSRRAICQSLPGASEKIEEQEEKDDWKKRKTNSAQADGLGVTSEFPLLRAAIESGDIPTSVFHQPSGEPVNVEFDLWEKALQQKGWAKVIYNIAKTASRRGTYEKDISPYLAFLFRIPKYLKTHTGKKWKAMPVFVESQMDLEMNEADENGTVKRRSAMTPVADNTTCIITVPYVALSVSGVRTQWCYSRFYHLFEEGFTDPESGGIVTKDFEPELNGRDDYGLMYYTLTGTDTARGYPTFLIIFERLGDETRVHFHRVRPQRIKDGKHTPACQLVEACYQYMAGNIPASDITAQQGDLIFVRHPNDPIKAQAKTKGAREGTVLEFESHRMASVSPGAVLKLYESTAKTPANRLGFLWAPGGLNVTHPEHQNLEGLVEGWYEIRRCRTFEASPRGIWSLTID